MDDLDRRIVAMVGAQEFVTIDHVARYLRSGDDDEAARRLGSLCGEGLLRRERLASPLTPVFAVTGAGLAAIGSRMIPARLMLSDVRHQVAAGMLWVAGWDGVFGDVSRVLSRREAEGLDRVAALSAGLGSGFGLELDGGVLYPDVSVVSSKGHRIAVYVWVWPFRSWDPEVVLAAYRDRQAVDAVLVLAEGQSAVDKVKATAARLEIGDWLYVRGMVTGARELSSG